MRAFRTSVPLAALLLALSLLFAASAPGQSPGTTEGGKNAGPAKRDAPLPCPELLRLLDQVPAEKRVGAYSDAMSKRCRPLPDLFWTAMREGKWTEGGTIAPRDRANLLSLAMRGKYTEAETLVVRAVETGRWPEGTDIPLAEAGDLVRSLGDALTPYRVRLLLDIYEQVPKEYVRFAVIQALATSDSDAALLPALDAFFNEKGSVGQLARGTLVSQPERAPARVLARLIQNLPEGPLLKWAVDLADQHPSEPVAQARKERGI